jgi:hypothetical protein
MDAQEVTAWLIYDVGFDPGGAGPLRTAWYAGRSRYWSRTRLAAKMRSIRAAAFVRRPQVLWKNGALRCIISAAEAWYL